MPKDFFISYTAADTVWAEWIAYVLEDAGFTTVVEAWDFRPGSNFVLEMQRAASEADRTIMLLSPNYLRSEFASSEWASAFARDPQGIHRKLLPIMVRQCEPKGLLGSIVHISLVGKDEDEAVAAIIRGVDPKRAKPSKPPSFPGAAKSSSARPFPGETHSRDATPYVPNLKRPASDAEKRRFSRQTFQVIKSYFQEALKQLTGNSGSVECDFEENTTTEFAAEVFVNGTSKARCQIWQGSLHSSDGISYSEGRQSVGGKSINESLSVIENGGDLYMSALMGSFSQLEKMFDLQRLTSDQAAEYLWRRFVTWLER